MLDLMHGAGIDASADRRIDRPTDHDQTNVGSTQHRCGDINRSRRDAVLASSEYSVLLALNEKFATRAPYKVAAIGEIECVVVEHDLARAEHAALSKAGTTIVAADAPEAA